MGRLTPEGSKGCSCVCTSVYTCACVEWGWDAGQGERAYAAPSTAQSSPEWVLDVPTWPVLLFLPVAPEEQMFQQYQCCGLHASLGRRRGPSHVSDSRVPDRCDPSLRATLGVGKDLTASSCRWRGSWCAKGRLTGWSPASFSSALAWP